MNKKDFIKYWIRTADKDWKAVQQLYEGKSYVQSLFFTHLILEKLCKALWIRDNENNHPPRIHNLNTLLSNTKIELTEEQLKFIILMNDFQLEGRYPDYSEKIYKRCNAKYTMSIIIEATALRKWLLKNLR